MTKPIVGLVAVLFMHGHVWAEPSAGAGYGIEQLVAGSPFFGVHGLGVDERDRLYAGSVVGQRIYRVDTKDGSVSIDVSLNRPVGIDVAPEGGLIVMEAAGRIVALDIGNEPIATAIATTIAIIAENIPMGRLNPDAGIQTPGLAVGEDGTIYALSDRENAVYRIRRQKQ